MLMVEENKELVLMAPTRLDGSLQCGTINRFIQAAGKSGNYTISCTIVYSGRSSEINFGVFFSVSSPFMYFLHISHSREGCSK